MNNQDILTWARAERKIMEMEAKRIVSKENVTDAELVMISVAFPYYKQHGYHAVGDICRDPSNEVLKKCIQGYSGDEHPDWTIENGTLWYAFHGISKDTAYPYVAPTGAHDVYKENEYMTYTDGSIYKCIADTSFSPDDAPNAWEKVDGK